MDKITHKVRCEQWTKIIKECLASGMNKTAWCREHGISDKSFFYWQRRLREEAYISTVESSSLPAVNAVSVPAEPSVDFVELRLSEQSAVYIPFQVNHLHGQTEPVPRRMRATLTETEPMLFYANYQATAC